MDKLSMLGIIVVVILGFLTIVSFEMRIVAYLKQMRDSLRELVEK